KDSKFEELRQKIQKVGLDVGKVIYGFRLPDVAVPHYEKIVIVGHSLGSVLAYDTLNALINLDNTSDAADQRYVVSRTRALLTFGSHLDKPAFIFQHAGEKSGGMDSRATGGFGSAADSRLCPLSPYSSHRSVTWLRVAEHLVAHGHHQRRTELL